MVTDPRTIDLVTKSLKGNRRAIGKLITLVENNAARSSEIMKLIHPHTGHAHIVGITGAPGSGKSTLVGQLAHEYRRQDKTIGIVAVDPTSPFTGGALLGDRVRMQDLSTDRGVFIRSLASRGALGGLSRATDNVIKILDAVGKDVILVETVGAGQSEIEIMNIAYTVVIVTGPGQGDEIQTLKAGILEIGHIFVANKADLQGIEELVSNLQEMLRYAGGDWKPPIVKTIALDGTGVGDLLEAIERHSSYLKTSDLLSKRQREKSETELERLVLARLKDQIFNDPTNKDELEKLIDQITNRELDPYSVAKRVISTYRKTTLRTVQENNT
ncbi:MAG: methylmalonyl Co-A mutase-associated GTPase MeaB [Candidatus Heimdallarchaeota archaeon]